MGPLASRKFLAVLAGLALVATARWTGADAGHVVTLVLAYVGAEGAGDAITRWKAEPEETTS